MNALLTSKRAKFIGSAVEWASGFTNFSIRAPSIF